MKPSTFKAVLGYSGIPGIRHYAITGNPDGQQTITIDVTNQEVTALKGRAIEVSIVPVPTREERLRAARLDALRGDAYTALINGQELQPPMLTAEQALQVIERVDAEFAKGETR